MLPSAYLVLCRAVFLRSNWKIINFFIFLHNQRLWWLWQRSSMGMRRVRFSGKLIFLWWGRNFKYFPGVLSFRFGSKWREEEIKTISKTRSSPFLWWFLIKPPLKSLFLEERASRAKERLWVYSKNLWMAGRDVNGAKIICAQSALS